MDMYRLQNHFGYDIYMLDMHIDHRFVDASGWPHMLRDLKLPTYMKEMFSIRMMRHLYFFKAGMTLAQWEKQINLDTSRKRGVLNVPNWAPQFFITKDRMLEARHPHPVTARGFPKMFARQDWDIVF